METKLPLPCDAYTIVRNGPLEYMAVVTAHYLEVKPFKYERDSVPKADFSPIEPDVKGLLENTPEEWAYGVDACLLKTFGNMGRGIDACVGLSEVPLLALSRFPKGSTMGSVGESVAVEAMRRCRDGEFHSPSACASLVLSERSDRVSSAVRKVLDDPGKSKTREKGGWISVPSVKGVEFRRDALFVEALTMAYDTLDLDPSDGRRGHLDIMVRDNLRKMSEAASRGGNVITVVSSLENNISALLTREERKTFSRICARGLEAAVAITDRRRGVRM